MIEPTNFDTLTTKLQDSFLKEKISDAALRIVEIQKETERSNEQTRVNSLDSVNGGAHADLVKAEVDLLSALSISFFIKFIMGVEAL